MKLIFTAGEAKHRFWHKIKLIKDTGFTKYYECTKCKTRIVKQPDTRYQPIDYNWLNFRMLEDIVMVYDNVGERYCVIKED